MRSVARVRIWLTLSHNCFADVLDLFARTGTGRRPKRTTVASPGTEMTVCGCASPKRAKT
jgi:hypothetical protein